MKVDGPWHRLVAKTVTPRAPRLSNWVAHPFGMFRACTTNTLDRWAESPRRYVRVVAYGLGRIVPSDWNNYFY